MDNSMHVARRNQLEEFEIKDRRILACVATLGATLSKDGDKWCYLLGENIQEGVCGFGDTPFLAAEHFASEFGIWF